MRSKRIEKWIAASFLLGLGGAALVIHKEGAFKIGKTKINIGMSTYDIKAILGNPSRTYDKSVGVGNSEAWVFRSFFDRRGYVVFFDSNGCVSNHFTPDDD
jgi:hypothetical protein